MFKFIRCTNPIIRHIKMAYGKLVESWKQLKCDCGYEFEEFTELNNEYFVENTTDFVNVDTEADTKILPAIKVIDKPK